MAHCQLLVVKKTDRVYPQRQMNTGYQEKNNGVVAISQLAVAVVNVGKYDQLQEHLEGSQTYNEQVELENDALNATLGALRLQDE